MLKYMTHEPKYTKLKGYSDYLCGSIDKAKDGGVGWRNDITPFLTELGITVYDPCDKKIDIGLENIESRQYRENLKASGQYDQLSSEVHTLRVVDLRMCDYSDFLIVNLDLNILSCGTYEEIFWANRLKRPIIIHCPQGKNAVPDWLYGTLDHRLFFDNWKDVKEYINNVNEGITLYPERRWLFFNWSKI
jgi:hypothetical protein